MLIKTICAMGFGLMIAAAFIGIAAVIVGGRSDEELGYKVPLEDLVSEGDLPAITPPIATVTVYESGKSEGSTA